jgi:hypothetical protein
MFTNFFIRRPIFASVCSLLIILIGAVSYTRLPVREYPDIEPPIVTVSTVYPGANPRVVETEVTEILGGRDQRGGWHQNPAVHQQPGEQPDHHLSLSWIGTWMWRRRMCAVGPTGCWGSCRTRWIIPSSRKSRGVGLRPSSGLPLYGENFHHPGAERLRRHRD